MATNRKAAVRYDEVLEALAAELELFSDGNRRTFASFITDGRRVVWPIRSFELSQAVRQKAYTMTHKLPNSNKVKDLTNMLEFFAHEADVQEVHTRVASFHDTVFIDLCNVAGEQVRIDEKGWKVISSVDSPVRFVRGSKQTALPRPTGGGSLNSIKDFVSFKNDEDRILFVANILMSFHPTGPFPMLYMVGPQGSGKSCACKLGGSLVDPTIPEIDCLPASIRDFSIYANNRHLMVFDNLSGCSNKMSDMLCRASTGGGFSTRALHTDAEEVSFNIKKPIWFNGITEFLTRQDACDRSCIVRTKAIQGDMRMPEQEFWGEWEKQKPAVLGSLYDAISMALKRYRDVRLSTYPRMADFVRWIVAAEPALPWEGGDFLKAYENNRLHVIESAIDADPVASAVIIFYQQFGAWEGTPTELLSALNCQVTEDIKRLGVWPKMPNSLSAKLARSEVFLREKLINVEFGKSKGQRYIALRPAVPSPPSQVISI